MPFNLQLLPKKGMDQSLGARARGRTDPVAENQHTIVVGCVVGYIVQEQIGKGWPVLIGTGLTMGGVFLVLHARFRKHAP